MAASDIRPVPQNLSSALAGALAGIAGDGEAAAADLARMVGVDTSFPPGAGYGAFADLMAEMVAPLGFSVRRVTVPETLWRVPGGPAHGARINLIADRRTGRPVCSLYFHVDTVRAAPGWRRDPLRLERDGDRLFGLGAADMKGTIAAVFLALRAAATHEVALAYDPALLFCTDEECGLYPGVRYLAEQGLIEGHVLNFNGVAAPRIWAGCFGAFDLLVRLRGRAAHAAEGARAGAGLNAIEASLPVLNALQALKPVVARRLSALPPPPHAAGPLAGQLSIVAAHAAGSGGQTPAQFEIVASRRYAPEENFDGARAEIETAIRSAAAPSGLSVEIDLIGHLIPTQDPTGPHWPRWREALSAGFGYRPDEFRTWGAGSSSDFGYVQKAGLQEALLGGLGRPERNIHAPDEHTTMTDIVALAQSVLCYLAAEFRRDLNPEITPDITSDIQRSRT